MLVLFSLSPHLDLGGREAVDTCSRWGRALCPQGTEWEGIPGTVPALTSTCHLGSSLVAEPWSILTSVFLSPSSFRCVIPSILCMHC